MRKNDLAAGVIYGFNRGWCDAALVLTTHLVYEAYSRTGPNKYELAPAGAPIYKRRGYSSHGSRQTGYLVLRGPGEKLEEVDCQAVLDAVLRDGQLPDGTPGRLDLLFSLAQLKGPWREMQADATAQRQAEREHDREKTRRYNAVARQLNLYLPERRQLRIWAESGDVWGQESPSVKLDIDRMEALVEGIERAMAEAYGRGIDGALQAFADREEAGEIIIVPREYTDEE